MFVHLLFISFHVVFCMSLLSLFVQDVGRFTGLFSSLLCFVYGVGLCCFLSLSLSTPGIWPWGPGNDGYAYDSSRFNDYDEVIPFSFLVVNGGIYIPISCFC
jgi:hypothetical protein